MQSCGIVDRVHRTAEFDVVIVGIVEIARDVATSFAVAESIAAAARIRSLPYPPRVNE